MVRDSTGDLRLEANEGDRSRKPKTPSGDEGYRRAIGLLEDLATPAGFLATPTEKANYRRVWSRDGIITGLAALLSEEDALLEAFERTLATLARHQGPQGEIPSNVDTVDGRVSYGGTAGRVDADLWFVIGCAEYFRTTEDEAFLGTMLPVLDRVDFLLRAWEFNNRGLLFVPPTGDWADEYLQSGYVLYDQLLYLQAQRSLAALRRAAGTGGEAFHEEKARTLASLIRANYWFDDVDEPPEHVYHEVLYRKGVEAPKCRCNHWMPFFGPHGYGYRFDAFANVLVSLLGVADETRRARVDSFISDLIGDTPPVLPAFHPVIEPVHEDWEDLQMTFSHTFKNNPYEYHNGGRWPMLTGFYVADLAARGKHEDAARFLGGIDWANSLPVDGEPWSFPEYVHGKDFTAGGTAPLGWSAAAAVIAHHAIRGKSPFTIPGRHR